jgi:protein-tyrosine sulfotransferase
MNMTSGNCDQPIPGISCSRPQVVWILGILQRSGTNYLRDLIELHPDCQTADPIGEDFLVANADKLQQYARGVAGDWNPDWDKDGKLQHELLLSLGEACVSFLTSRACSGPGPSRGYVVTKTPSVKNLPLLTLFPRSRAVVIVRDGRDMIVSGMNSFGWTFETMCRQWADAARTIQSAQAAGVPFLLVRYEDLLSNLRATLAGVFSYLDIDAAAYDYEAAAKLPVKGSSSFGTDGGGVHWRPVAKTADFNPLRRWAGWDAARHERFNWIAGAESAGFGYEPVCDGRRPGYWKWWNRWQDFLTAFSRRRSAVKRLWRRGESSPSRTPSMTARAPAKSVS